MPLTFSVSSLIVLGLLQFENTYTNGQRTTRSAEGQSVGHPPFTRFVCMANGDRVFPARYI